MSKLVLIVDDDTEMLTALQEGFQRYRDSFSVLAAASGAKALALMAEKPVSLLVTDLKMPGMDGFDLLGRVMESYPDIPVVIMTGYSTPEMKKMARKGGAVGYIAKPFLVEDLARKIVTVLRRESEGGTLHGVSSGIFLQLIEMEERTCTIRLQDAEQGQQGVLFFRGGELFDARIGGLQGVEAAYEIFSWGDVSIAIQNECPQIRRQIQEDLQAVLLEAMRRKDENAESAGAEAQLQADPAPDANPPGDGRAAEEEALSAVRRRLQAELGDRTGVREVYADPKWDSFVARFDELGRSFGAGGLAAVFVDRGEGGSKALLPHVPTTVVELAPKCARDRLIQALGRITNRT